MTNHCYYTFTYTSSEGETTSFPLMHNEIKNCTFSDETPWPVILREFANFLSGIYGYNITEKVIVNDKLEGEYCLQDAE